MPWCCGAGWSAVEKGFNHDAQLACLHMVAHLHYPQPNGIKENGFEMGEHPLEAPAVPVFGLYINTLNYTARCRLSLYDFYLKEAKASANRGTSTGPPALQVWRAR